MRSEGIHSVGLWMLAFLSWIVTSLAQMGPGSALSFAGSGDMMSIGGSPIAPPWTAEFWVNRQDAPGPSAVLLADYATGLKLEQFAAGRRVGITHYGVADRAFNYGTPVGTWVHLAFVGTPNATKLYVDGVLMDTIAVAMDLPMGQVGNDRFNDRLRATIDEVRVWTVERSANEIQANMNSTLSLPQVDLASYWRFDEGTGTIVADASGNGHDGVLVGGPAWVTSTMPFGPIVVTGPAIATGTNSAVLQGTVNPNSMATMAWFQWGVSTNYGNSTIPTPVGGDNINHPFDAVLTNLTPASTYHCQLVASNQWGVTAGGNQSFKVQITTIPIQAVRVSDDDGARKTHITPEEVLQWMDFANRVWSRAGIQFVFNPSTDFVDVRSTAVNNITGTGDANWTAEVRAANAIAARYKGKLTIIFRWGSGISPTGGGFSWWDYSFVVCPGFLDTWHCGQQNFKVMAHEIGHHLGLPHTFGALFAAADQASAFLAANGNNPAVFEGDGFSDTPPHPSIRSQECPGAEEIVLNGIAFDLPRSNIMSYYFEASSLTPQQIQRARWVTQNYLRHEMLAPSNQELTNQLEAESLIIDQTYNAVTAVQQMAGFGVGWSADAQVWCGINAGGYVTMRLPVSQPGLTWIDIYATQAPDFGTFRFYLDDKLIGGTLDAYAPIVLPTGRFSLGSAMLTAGNHRLRIQSSGKNALSSHFGFGVDALVLTPMTRPYAGTNIALLGEGIMGFQGAIDSSPGTRLYHAGLPVYINDGDLSSRVDNFSSGSDAGQGVSFVGIVWPSLRHEQISSIVLTLAAFPDGGWFGLNGRSPGWGGTLRLTDLVEPTAQVSTDRGLTWTNVTCAAGYMDALVGQFIGGTAENPAPLTATFSFDPPLTNVNGIRLIGFNGGTGDGNGFLGVFELAIEATPAAQAVLLRDPQVVSNQFRFLFDTQSDKRYTVEYKNSFADPAWHAVTNFSGDGTRVSVTNALVGEQRFYRVLTQ